MKTLYSEYSGEIKFGDVIAVAYSNSMEIGIYLGRGQGDSMQYYGVRNLRRWLDNRIEWKSDTPYKFYIVSSYTHRFVKVSIHSLKPEHAATLVEAASILNIPLNDN